MPDTMQAATRTRPVEIRLHGVIGTDVRVEELVRQIRAAPADAELHLRIHSGGGSYWDAVAIFDALAAHPGRVVTFNEGLAASGASLIFTAGTERRMARNAFVMVHLPQAEAAGDAIEMRRMAATMDAFGERMARAYAERTGLPATRVHELLAAETWMDADTALRLGFATHIGPAQRIAASAGLNLAAFTNPPRALLAAIAGDPSMSEAATVTEPAAAPAEVLPPAAAPLATLRAIAARASLPDGWVLENLERGTTEAAAREAAMDALASRAPQRPATITPMAGPSLAEPAVRLAAMQAALAHRMGGPAPAANDPARHFMGMTASAMWREELATRGVRNAHRMPAEALIRATASSGMITTSDFPDLLSGAGSRVLAAAYQAAISPLRRLAAQRTVPNFKEYLTASAASFPPLQRVPEHGEITHGSLATASEKAKVETFARKLAATRQAIVNDDLDAFGRAARAVGTAVADVEARELVRLLLGDNGGWTGPVMSDGNRLISSAHGNLGGVGTSAVTAANLTAARVAMRRQVDLNGTPVGVTPRFIVVPPELEAEAETMLAPVLANGATNPVAGRLELLVEPRFTAGRWWLFGDLPVLEMAYLDGKPLVPTLEGALDSDTLGVTFTIVHDVGVGVTDHRGIWRSVEAA
jgi:ATP-dependent protease ClpP protease subunit